MKKRNPPRIQTAEKSTRETAERPKFRLYPSRVDHRFVFWLLVGVIVLFRVLLFSSTVDDPYIQFRVGDEAHYHEWALKIADGQLARGTSFFTTPLYAYFLGLMYAVGVHSIPYVRFINVLMGMVTAILLYMTARRYLSQNRSIVALALFGFCTAPIFYEWFTEKTSLVLFFTATTFYLVSFASENRKTWAWLLAGLSAGLASLGHMLLMVFIPATWVYLFFKREHSGAAMTLKFLAVFTLGFFLGVSPATIHNYLQDRDFVMVSSNGGQNFYVSNHAGNFTGEYISPPFSVANIEKEEANFKEEAERRTQHAMKPSEVSRFWFRQGWVEMLRNPRLSLTRFWNRLRWAAGAEEPSDTRTYEFYQARYQILNPPFWGFGVVSCLGLVGLFLTIRRREYLPLTLFILFFAAGISVFFVYGRYRLPLLIPLSIMAATTLGQAYAWVKEKRVTALVLLVLGTGAVAWLLRGPVLPANVEVSFFPDYYNQGNKYWNLGKFELATAEYEKALSVRPGDHPAVPSLYNFLTGVYMKTGQYDRAEALMQRALARYPGNPEIQETLRRIRSFKQTPAGKARAANPQDLKP